MGLGDYTYSETIIDGKKYGSMSDIVPHEMPDLSVENLTLQAFTRFLESSRESSTRLFASVVKKLRAKHLADGEDIRNTSLYVIARECEEKSFRTKPDSVEREFLLISAINTIKKAYDIDVI